MKLEEIDELAKFIQEINEESLPPINAENGGVLNWQKFAPHDRAFFIYTGKDRNGKGQQYGPFSLEMLKKL